MLNAFNILQALLESDELPPEGAPAPAKQHPADTLFGKSKTGIFKELDYYLRPYDLLVTSADNYYQSLLEKFPIKRKDRKKIENNTWFIKYPDGTVAIRLHNTDIITCTPDNVVTFDTGGWHTIITRDRMNKYMPSGLSVCTHRGEMLWNDNTSRAGCYDDPENRRLHFTDGDQIKSGILHMQKAPKYLRKRKPRA